MKYSFIDTIHLMTDRMGGWLNQWVEIGWYDQNSNQYFNPDEVRKIYDEGQAENVKEDENGKLYMCSQWMDARTAFNVVCGIPFRVSEKNQNLLDYAKKIGVVCEQPVPIEMFSGVKTLEINSDGTYNVVYTIKTENYEKISVNMFRRVCVGSILRLIHSKNTEFICKDVYFDDDRVALVINGISSDSVASREFIDNLRNLDLELLIANSNLVNYSNVIAACDYLCRDLGQYHWIKETEKEGKEKSNIYWYEKYRKE